jgi:hypothetical protein
MEVICDKPIAADLTSGNGFGKTIIGGFNNSGLGHLDGTGCGFGTSFTCGLRDGTGSAYVLPDKKNLN